VKGTVTIGVLVVTSSVYPSGSLLATAPVPIISEPPGRFSTMTV
jgi:hypothetical protein